MPSSFQFQPPPLAPGLSLRTFRGPVDYPRMVEVANACSAADRVDIVRTVESMASDYAAFTECDPFRDIVVAEIDGQMVGYARGWRRLEISGTTLLCQLGFVEPRWRRRGIGRVLVGAMEQHQRALAAAMAPGGPAMFNIFLTEHEKSCAALLSTCGYTPARYFHSMRRPHLRDIEMFRLPTGIETRPVRAEHYEAIWAADIEAFNDHWGRAQWRDGDYEAWLGDKIVFQPQLWCIAWDVSKNEIAGQVRAFVNAQQNAQFNRLRGYTEFISVRAPWRRQGIARALIARSLMAQRDAGLTESQLEVDSANATGATRVYEDCGFEVVKRNVVYRKTL